MERVQRSENNRRERKMRKQNDSENIVGNQDERKNLKAKDIFKRLKRNKISLFLPFKGLDRKHKLIFCVAIVTALGSGAGFPLFNVYFGEILKGLIDGSGINDILLIYLSIAVAQFFLSCLAFYCIELVSKHVTNNLKLKFLSSVFYLDGEFHDENPGSKLNSDLEFYLTKIRSGISVKFIMIFTYFTTFMMLFGWSLYESYRLTLCIALVFPLLFIFSRVCHKYAKKYQTKSLLYSNNSLSIAEEAFVGIRTVAAYCGEKLMLDKFQKSEKYYSKYILKANLFESLNTGFINLFVLSGYALGFWYGTKMILDQFEASMGNIDPDAFDGASVLSILIGILVAMFMLTIMLPALNDYLAAVDSTNQLYEVINRKSKIKNEGMNGEKLQSVDKIEFRNVKFRYTMRNDVDVYRGLNFELKKGQVYAFVGESGCGKSTILKLIERYYDPTEGDIIINDGYSLKDLNVKWWRAQIGIVSQEPRLFSRSIASNIKYSLISQRELDELSQAGGNSGWESNVKSTKRKIGDMENKVSATNNSTKKEELGINLDFVSNSEVHKIGKKSLIHDFISTLPRKYNTIVGSNAADLSGGQKQRISIARAIFRNPHILILDEATSSLDNKSEHMVQTTINKLEGSESRITIIVAHRLSTIRYANTIFVLSNKTQEGEENNKGSYIAEVGTHEELLKNENGLYYSMLKNQKLSTENNDENGSKPKRGSGNSEESSYERLNEFIETSSGGSTNINKVEMQSSKEDMKTSSRCFSCKNLFKWKKSKKNKKGFSYIYKEILKNKKYVALCFFFILFTGGLYPFFGLVFARFIRILFDIVNAKKNSERFAVYIVLISIGMCIGETLQNYYKCVIGENVEKVTKKKLMENIIHQEISFFEEENHAPGILLSYLNRDVHLLKVGFVNNLGVVIHFIVMSLVSGVMSFYYCPIIAIYLTFIYFCLSRLLAIKQSYTKTDDVEAAYKGKQMCNVTEEEMMENVDFLIQEAFLNMEVVVNYGLENYYIGLIKKSLELSYKKERVHHIKRSILWGLSQCAQLIAHASTYWISSKLISEMNIDVNDLFDSIFVFLITGNYAGKLLANKGSAIEAEESFAKYYPLMLKKSTIDSRSESGIRIDKNKAKGIVEIKQINFRYPSRPAIPIYNNLSFTCDEKQTTAIVGQTGCGKSTIMGLLLKYYSLQDEHVLNSRESISEDITNMGEENNEHDMEYAQMKSSFKKSHRKEEYDIYRNSGEILIDGININDYNLRDMRGLFSIVTQEPMLFNMSIYENVTFGVDEATIEDVKRVCKIAAIDEFVESLPEKYDTNVGPFGKNLSGGQKQRVTLARALLKNPHILLLDEATSSLDSNSEKLIEEAFEKIKGKRDTTIITIAHRISSIKRSDKIVVLNNPDKLGSSVQAQGTHNELLAMKDSIYTKYVNLAS